MKKKLILISILFIFLNSISILAGSFTIISQPDSTTGKDSWLYQGLPTQNYGNLTTINIDSEQTNKLERGVLEFNLSAVSPLAHITSANLELYQTTGTGATFGLALYRITSSWNEAAVTWNSRDGINNWIAGGGDYVSTVYANVSVDNSLGWKTWSIQKLVQEWINGTFANQGMILVPPPQAGNNEKNFASSDNANVILRPKLTINYTLPLTFTFVNPTPNSGSTILTNSAVINISLTNGNATQAQLEWNGVNYSMDAGSSLPSTTWSLSKTSLANGIYTYKVYALDSGTGVFDVSETRTVTVNACTENWVASYGDCLTDDTKLKYYNDTNYCGTYDNLPIDNGTYAACDYCSYSTINTSWSSWQNQTSCLANDTFKQNQSRTEYDANAKSCYAITNLVSDLWNNGLNNTYWNYQSIACDYILSTEFSGTDFSSADPSNISNLILTTSYGIINFSEPVSFAGSTDLDFNVDISNNFISINTINLPELNKSAVLTLYNLTFINPTILKDGLPCEASICTKISYETGSAGSDLTFNVSGFSNYSAAEGMYCGDSSCNNGESCSSCPVDCGSCSDGNSGGSGGGGSSRTSSSLTKEVVPKEAVSITSPTQQTDISRPYSSQPSSLETSETGKEAENAEQAGHEEPATNEKNWAEMMFDSPELELKTNGEKEFTIFQLPENIKASLLTGAAIKTFGKITEEVKKNMNDIIVFLLVMFGAASVTYLTLNGIDSKSCRKAKTSRRKNKQKNNCSKKSSRNR